MRSDSRTASSRQGLDYVAIFVRASRAGQRNFSLTPDVVDRRAQVMRNVGREFGYSIEGILQPIQHLVEGAGQRRHLEWVSLGKNAFPKVCRTNVTRGRRHLFHRTNAVPGDTVPD